MGDEPWSLSAIVREPEGKRSKPTREPWDLSGAISKIVTNKSSFFWEQFGPDFVSHVNNLETLMIIWECERPGFYGWFGEFMERSYEDSAQKVSEEIESVYDFLYEKSHGNLKYTYRMGFDPLTGKQVAVEFLLEPDKITSVGDPIQTRKLATQAGRNPSDEEIEKKHTSALDIVKQTAKKFGHIDHITRPLTVSAIFDSSRKKMDKVRLIPLIPAINKIGFACAKDLSKKQIISSDELDSFLSDKKFQELFIQKAKDYLGDIENYHVSRNNSEGEKQGNGKYKSTKLFWGVNTFQANQFTPVIRGFVQQNRDHRRENAGELYDNYTVYNKPKRKSSQ